MRKREGTAWGRRGEKRRRRKSRKTRKGRREERKGRKKRRVIAWERGYREWMLGEYIVIGSRGT